MDEPGKARHSPPWKRTVALAAMAAALAAGGCVPASFQQVQTPRAGRALNGRAAIVYSKHYQIHQGDIYPHPKAASDLDVPLPAGTGDREYMTALGRHWPAVLDRFRPDIVFFVAGADVLADDPLAGMRLTIDGVVARDAAVIDACADRKIPVAMVLAGGYGKNAWLAQCRSIARTLRQYGQPDGRPYPPRDPTLTEKCYVR